MPLDPRCPPGRSNRKARAFEVEIGRLRAEGYGFETIRQALADAGVHVSDSTVRREAARYVRRQDLTAADRPGPAWRRSAEAAAAHESLTTVPRPADADPRSGKEIAEAFISGRITNPLIRARINDESRRH